MRHRKRVRVVTNWNTKIKKREASDAMIAVITVCNANCCK